MSKFDKKVLKYVAAHQEDDLDIDDIAIGLRLDEDDVREALDSLKDQGKVEGSPRNGKTFWRLSIPESETVEETKQLNVQNGPDVVAIDLDQAIAEQSFKRMHAPVSQKMEPDEIEKNPEPSAAIVSPPKQSVPDIDDAGDDTDMDLPQKLGDSPVVRIAVAVVLSVVISAVISIIIAGNSQKGFSDGIQALERKSTETNAKLEKRIAETSAQLSVVSDKLSGRQQQPRTEQNRAAAAASKPSHASHKKRASSRHAPADENPASSSEPSTSSASDQSSPSSTSGQSDNPAPAPESTPPSSTEGTGGSGQ